MRLPTFIIGGAPRSGTTWLAGLCDRHPEIYMAKPVSPEPKFFLVDEIYERGLDYYARTWFEAAGVARVVGEKSTNYLESPVAAARMRHDLPHVKLIFILRNPVDRAFSNYAWSRMNGHETEGFAEALAREEARERSTSAALKYARPHAYFSRGVYANLLEPYLQFFPREQVLVLKFEDAVSNGRACAGVLHRYLGVAPRPEDAEGLGPINRSDPPTEPISADVRAALRDRYREPNARLAAMLDLDFSGWDR